MVAEYADLDIKNALKLLDDSGAKDLLQALSARRESVREEQERFIDECDRFDQLFYAEGLTKWGADLWADDPSATMDGRSHVSVNTAHVYVTIPSALQSVVPVENMLATDTTDEAREAAAAMERVRYAWKRKEKWNLKRHKAVFVKSLYGRSAARVYWQPAENGEKGYPCVEIIDQPRNLWLGYKTDAYDKLQWAAYVQRMSPEAVLEEFSVDIEGRDLNGKVVPWVTATNGTGVDSTPSRTWLHFGNAMIEVWDYWFLKKKGDIGTIGGRTKMAVWNAVFVGGALVRYEEHPEFQGKLPFKVLFNDYLPGIPNGRSELYDIEQIIREKYETITALSQAIHAAVGGTAWQLVGPETTAGQVPQTAKPKIGQIISPGPGARIETVQPMVMEFQGEQYLDRLDYEGVTISGLNPLLLGHSPSQALSSSKAINAFIATYVTRLAMKRGVLYEWDGDIWDLAVTVWAYKDATIAGIVDAGSGDLDITDPSLNPRDEMEQATRILNLVNGGLMADETGMDHIGIDDPQTEIELIKAGNTDATRHPEKVMTMATLLGALQSVGAQAPQQVQQGAGAQQNALRGALGTATPDNTTGSQLPGDQGIMPPEGMVPGAPAAKAGGGAPTVRAPQRAQLQGMVTAQGQTKSRILTRQDLTKLGRR
jgi:hypothetical protein